jgi:sugar lactone lactonase YvrE
MATFRTIALGLTLVALACGDEDENNEETATEALLSGAPTILVDLDPSSTGTTVTIESIGVNADGVLFVSDRESGNVYSVDPEDPLPAVVGKLEDRTDAAGAVLKANGAGLVFTPGGDLLIASGAFNEVLRLTAAELRAGNASAQTHITGVRGANSVLLLGDDLYVTGGATGNIYVAPASGGAADIWATIEPTARAVPPDNFMQAVVANGIARDPKGDLLVADTARAAIWRIPVNGDGSAGTAEIWVQETTLEGIDGLTFDPRGRLWAAVNEHNALVVVQDEAIREVVKNGNTGPLEFPAALVFVGNTGYVANFDRARASNFAPDGTTSSAGIGSSIAQFQIAP